MYKKAETSLLKTKNPFVSRHHHDVTNIALVGTSYDAQVKLENIFSDLITYHDPNSCHWIQFPHHCKTDAFTDTTTKPTTQVTSSETTHSTFVERSLVRHTSKSSTTSTSTSTAEISQIATTPKVPSTTKNASVLTKHDVHCDNLLENLDWDCSNSNKPGSLCVRFCNDNAFESKRCLCNSKSICAWTVKGKPCVDENKLTKDALEDKLGSLTSIFKYVDIVNTPNGKININFDLKRDKPRTFL